VKLHRVIAGLTASAVVGLLSVASTAAAPAVVETAPATGSTYEKLASGTAYEKYVALGDSYSSAPLVPLPELLSLGCVRSTSNYPKLLAGLLRVSRFTDVSCGGADTTNMTQPQSTPLGVFPPQFNALTPDTDLVTVGIGGNDFGVFGRIIDTCPAVRAEDPTGAPCKKKFTVDGVDTLKADIAKTRLRITEVAQGIKQRAPSATVVLIGYPKIAPAQGTCPAILPFADGDYAYLYSIEQELNLAIETAAEAAGVLYLDTFGPSTGHDACAPDGQAWIQGKDINLLRALNYHPRFEGQAGVAALTFKKLTGVPETITAAEQVGFARQGRELSRQAAKTNLPQAYEASMARLRTSAQR
jgi:lysophospholipase L1-like esterase